MNATPAAAFVTVVALGVLFAISAAFGFWLVDRIQAHFERTELDSFDAANRAYYERKAETLKRIHESQVRHPSTFRLDDADGVTGGDHV